MPPAPRLPSASAPASGSSSPSGGSSSLESRWRSLSPERERAHSSMRAPFALDGFREALDEDAVVRGELEWIIEVQWD